MEFYFSPGACSMATHIALNELGLKHKMHKVDLKKHTYDGDKDFYQVNPKGYVPALKTDKGDLLTENAVLLQYVADQKPESKLMPAQGSIERYHAMEWMNYIATELHKKFGPFWDPTSSAEDKKKGGDLLKKRFAYAGAALEKSEFLMGSTLTAPDLYLYVMVNWAKHHKIEVPPSLMKFHEKLTSRASVQETLKMEGLA